VEQVPFKSGFIEVFFIAERACYGFLPLAGYADIDVFLVLSAAATNPLTLTHTS